MCDIKGKRVRIKILEVEDVFKMKNWKTHDDPLFKNYNFPILDENEIVQWHKYRTSRKNTKYFSVFDEKNNMIGFISIRNIRKIRKTASLGIVFDPKVLNKGYGTETIALLLNYYFKGMKMRAMYLTVARFNKRAIRCYEKCGFKIFKQYEEKDTDLLEEIFDDKSDIWNKEFFLIKDSIVYCRYYEMRIKKSRK